LSLSEKIALFLALFRTPPRPRRRSSCPRSLICERLSVKVRGFFFFFRLLEMPRARLYADWPCHGPLFLPKAKLVSSSRVAETTYLPSFFRFLGIRAPCASPIFDSSPGAKYAIAFIPSGAQFQQVLDRWFSLEGYGPFVFLVGPSRCALSFRPLCSGDTHTPAPQPTHLTTWTALVLPVRPPMRFGGRYSLQKRSRPLSFLMFWV